EFETSTKDRAIILLHRDAYAALRIILFRNQKPHGPPSLSTARHARAMPLEAHELPFPLCTSPDVQNLWRLNILTLQVHLLQKYELVDLKAKRK
mgnify:CR=1